jgi:AraC-like DNA-binding protein
MTGNAKYSSYVKDSLRRMVADGERPTLARVALAVDSRARTVQRLLEQEGGTFSGLLREVRLELTLGRLKANGRSAGAMARDLGYSDRTAFSRAFKRWTGVPLSKFVTKDPP